MINVRLFYWDMETGSIPGYFQHNDENIVYVEVAKFPFLYAGEDILEKLFRVFNYEEHEDLDLAAVASMFGQRSMSIGDVVVLNIEGREQWNLCDRMGWKVIEPNSINIKEDVR